MKNALFFIPLAWLMLLGGCTGKQKKTGLLMGPNDFRVMHDGKQVDLFTLKNKNGMVVQITNFGGKIVSIIVPDKEGKMADVCLGYDSIEGYFNGSASMGATMGRVTNRIGGGQFTLNGQTYHLAKNAGNNTIHGGEKGFRFQVFDAKQIDDKNLELTYFSKDGEEGFPGNLHFKVLFTLTDDNELKITYHATTDKPTVVNFTNHAYFNLAGEGNGDILGHELLVEADSFTPTDKEAIPTGEIRSVEGTPLDFRQLTRIGDRVDADYGQIKIARGIDHNFVLNKGEGELGLAAILHDPASGRVMEVFTTEPGVQVYTANGFKSVGKGGKEYGTRSAVCIETQHFPDSPNRPEFPSVVLNPGDEFESMTIYKFSVRD